MNRGQTNNIWTPEVSQHGGHMIMENVKKPSKIKYVNIDSRFQEEYNSNKGAAFSFQLPQKLNEVKSIAVRSIEIPITFYYFSAKRGNTSCKVTDNNGNSTNIIIPDGNYSVDSIQSALTGIMVSNLGDTALSVISGDNCTIANHPDNTLTYTIHWDVDIDGNFQKSNFKSSLGWCLGFRQPAYTIAPNGGSITSEGVVDVHNTRYFFLVVDEFRQSNPNSFISPLPSSLISKNILARITLNPAIYPYGTILTANTFNGLLLSDQRLYAGKTDIQKLNIQLVDEWGNVVDLNGVDFSFCLEIEHE